MSSQEAVLIEPTEELGAELLEMAREYSAAGEARYQDALNDLPGYIRGLLDGARGAGLPAGRVPYSTFWLASGRRLIGRSSIRHYLTADLAHEGGHIGYDVRPAERGRGYGTLLLGRTLEEARRLGLGRVLLTCDADNVASAKVIERNGGSLRGQAASKISGKLISRYWIEL